VEVYGCSFDQPAVNAAFKATNNYQYRLLSDADRELALAYGAATSVSQFFASRVTVLLDPTGHWVLKYDVTDVSKHPQHVLDDITAILAAQ